MYAAVPRIIPTPVVIAGDVIVGEFVDDRPPLRRRPRLHRLRQPEVEHLDGAVRPHLDVRRLQIAMDDPLLVRGLERLGNLPRDRQRLVDGIGPARSGRPASAPRPVP